MASRITLRHGQTPVSSRRHQRGSGVLVALATAVCACAVAGPHVLAKVVLNDGEIQLNAGAPADQQPTPNTPDRGGIGRDTSSGLPNFGSGLGSFVVKPGTTASYESGLTTAPGGSHDLGLNDNLSVSVDAGSAMSLNGGSGDAWSGTALAAATGSSTADVPAFLKPSDPAEAKWVSAPGQYDPVSSGKIAVPTVPAAAASASAGGPRAATTVNAKGQIEVTATDFTTQQLLAVTAIDGAAGSTIRLDGGTIRFDTANGRPYGSRVNFGSGPFMVIGPANASLTYSGLINTVSADFIARFGGEDTTPEFVRRRTPWSSTLLTDSKPFTTFETQRGPALTDDAQP